MALAYSYDIKYVIIGQDPYPSHIVPYFGSAYSQSRDTQDTPTTRIIYEHFNGPDDNGGLNVRNMIRENWRLIQSGYLFVNSDFSGSHKRTDVERLETYDIMIEYIFSVCVNHKKLGYGTSVTVIGLGTAAHHIAVTVCARLRAAGVSSKATLDGQPARLARLTCGHSKIGVEEAYSCLSATTLRVFRKAAIEWCRVQGSPAYTEQLLKMSSNQNNNLNTVFMTTVSSLIEQLSSHMNASPIIPVDPEDVTNELVIEIGNHGARSTQLFYELACALAADTSVKETISQKIVASAAANSQFKRVTRSIVSSGSQRPAVSVQASVASGSSANLTHSLGTTGTRVSKFSALKGSKSIEGKTDNSNLGGSSRALDFGSKSNPDTNMVAVTTPTTKVRSVPVAMTGYSPVPPTIMSSGSKFSKFRKSSTPRSPPGSTTPASVPRVVTIAPNLSVANPSTGTPPTPTEHVRNVQPRVEKGGLFARLPRKSFE